MSFLMSLMLNDPKLEYSPKIWCIRPISVLSTGNSNGILDFLRVTFTSMLQLLRSTLLNQLISSFTQPPCPVSRLAILPTDRSPPPTRSQLTLWLPPANCRLLVDLSLYLPEQSRAEQSRAEPSSPQYIFSSSLLVLILGSYKGFGVKSF